MIKTFWQLQAITDISIFHSNKIYLTQNDASLDIINYKEDIISEQGLDNSDLYIDINIIPVHLNYNNKNECKMCGNTLYMNHYKRTKNGHIEEYVCSECGYRYSNEVIIDNNKKVLSEIIIDSNEYKFCSDCNTLMKPKMVDDNVGNGITELLECPECFSHKGMQ